jgi:ribokinase
LEKTNFADSARGVNGYGWRIQSACQEILMTAHDLGAPPAPQMPHVVVLGSSNTDLIIAGERLPRPGETVLGGRFYRAGGGKGANQAIAARRAGANVRLIAHVGDDEFGAIARLQFRHDGIDDAFVAMVRGVASGVALILVDHSGQNLISVAAGANATVSADRVRSLPEEAFPRGGVFVTQLEVPVEAVALGLRRARSAGMTTVLNPAPIEPTIREMGLLSLVDVLVANEHEAAALVGIDEPASDVAAARSVVGRLRALGARHAIITLGGRGYVLDDGAEPIHVPAHQVEAIDAVAAGDAFVGVLACALAEGRSLRDAALWANRAAAIAVTRPGAQPSLPTRDEIDGFSAPQGNA